MKTRTLRCAVCGLLVVSLTGCESMQRKFTRKRKTPLPRPTPIITFQDYTRTMTPLDRYRKHYLMFDYWNDELIRGLQGPSLNPKQLKRASSESLTELQTMQQLVTNEIGARMTPLLEERSKVDRDIQRDNVTENLASTVARTLEAETRQIHRDFFWRDVQDYLVPQQAPASTGSASATPPMTPTPSTAQSSSSDTAASHP